MELNEIFCDGMVLAAKKTIRIFGKGQGTVTVKFLQYEGRVESKEETWTVEFPAQDVGGPYTMEIDLNGKRITISDVYIGEVILLNGQSNLQFKLRESSFPADRYESCALLRLFSPQRISEGERFFPSDGWVKCRSEQAGDWSAIGYHVGLEIAKKKHCAVGLIVCYQEASVIESWMPEGILEEVGISLAPEDMHMDHFKMPYAQWNAAGTLYHYMVEKIKPYPLSHILWYQGESNSTVAESAVYGRLLKRLIKQRRIDFCDDTLPFIVVQIANYDPRDDEGWHGVQSAQMHVCEEVPFVTTVVSADVCETDKIHPPTKEKLSERISNVILQA